MKNSPTMLPTVAGGSSGSPAAAMPRAIERMMMSALSTSVPSHAAIRSATDGALSEEELDAGRRLVEEKFGTEEWTHRVP